MKKYLSTFAGSGQMPNANPPQIAEPDKENTAHDKPFTLAKLSLEEKE